MDDAALFEVACGPALNGLARADHLLDVIAAQTDPAEVLAAQIAPHVFDCAGQLRTVTSFAYRCVFPVIDRPWHVSPDGADMAALRAQIVVARDALRQVTASDFAGAARGRVRHRAGEADLSQSGSDYVMTFAVPNLWFHLTMAYATLRARGIDVGKSDFDGLHVYAKGFHFD